MKRIFNAIVFTALTASAVASRAECVAPVTCDNVRILSLYTNAVGDTYLQVAGTVSNLSCSPVSGIYLTLASGDQHYKEIYANLLAWQAMDRPLGVRVDQGSVGCHIVYVYTSAS